MQYMSAKLRVYELLRASEVSVWEDIPWISARPSTSVRAICLHYNSLYRLSFLEIDCGSCMQFSGNRSSHDASKCCFRTTEKHLLNSNVIFQIIGWKHFEMHEG